MVRNTDMDEPKIYKIDREIYIAAYRKGGVRLLKMVAVVSVMIGAIFPFYQGFMLNTRITGSLSVYVAVVVTISFFAFLLFLIYPGIPIIYLRKRHLKLIDHYELELGNDYIVRRQPEATDRRLERNQVQKMIVNEGGIYLYENARELPFRVSKILLNKEDDFEQVGIALKSWGPVRPLRQNEKTLHFFRNIGFVLLFTIYMLSLSIFLNVALGTVLIVYLVYKGQNTWKQPDITKTYKWMDIVIRAYFIAIIGYRILITFTKM